jgi:putative CocE/NonD family hydrolase
MIRKSLYLTMRDGVRIAVDVYLPRQPRDGKTPAVLHQTRYQRGVIMHAPFDRVVKTWIADSARKSREFFVKNGYAWIDVDARGSGASFGNRPCPWYEEEVRDGADIVDWIIRQPWSNGAVGATGISYTGTTAEMLLVNRHPAVKAAIPRFSLFDVFTDVAFPGGMHQFYFTKYWGRMNKGFDRNDPHEVLGMWLGIMSRGLLEKARMDPQAAGRIASAADRAALSLMEKIVKGVRPADDDPDYKTVQEAVADHAVNFDVHEAAVNMTFRDDATPSALAPRLGSVTVDYFSPHTYAEKIDNPGCAVFSYGGWWDMAYQHAAIKRHMTLSNPHNRLIIGPWDHAGRHNIGPTHNAQPCNYDHNAELLRFFDFHLKGKDTGMDPVPRVRWFTMGQAQWKSADTWPPRARNTELYLGPKRSLTFEAPAKHGADSYVVDYDAGSGDLSRWTSGVGATVNYSDRKWRDRRLLVYESAPLARDMEVTGHPVVTLHVTSTASDGYFIAYLEETTPLGAVRYVTEGNLRAIHRKESRKKPPYALCVPYHTFLREDAMPMVPGEPARIAFDLLPTSYLFRRGNRIRLALSGADRHHYINPPGQPPSLLFHRGGRQASFLRLPVVEP